MDADPIRFEGVELGYGSEPILREVSLSLPDGAAVGMVGPNGAGKTTLLRALLGILAPRAGTIHLRAGLRIAFVPQRERFDPVWPLVAEEVVLQGVLPEKPLFSRIAEADRARARAAMESTGIAHQAGASFRDLSGGQQQRVVLARALVQEPEWLVLDEPTAGLDMDGTRATLELVERIRAERGLGVILVSHHLPDVLNHMEHLALVGEGRVRVLPMDAADRDEALSRFYGFPLEVHEVAGHRVAVPRDEARDG